MRSTISVELGGTTFEVDDGAYRALRAYLDRAGERLGSHPDRSEVLAGLEHSIAARLRQRASAPGVPIDETEMRAALKEVGRVDGPALDDSGDAATGGAGQRPRPLYRPREGRQVAGVCAGLALYTGIDVGLVRLGFILGAIFTGGTVAIAYVVLMVVMPLR
jgi:phage shock protein PspC (stress-responsive transcriptional regulator)